MHESNECQKSHQQLRKDVQTNQMIYLAADSDIHLTDRKSTRLNSSHSQISYAVFCLKKKKTELHTMCLQTPTCMPYLQRQSSPTTPDDGQTSVVASTHRARITRRRRQSHARRLCDGL